MHLLQSKTAAVISEFISKKYGFCKVGELAIQGKSGSLLGTLRMNSNRNSKAILLEVKRRKIPAVNLNSCLEKKNGKEKQK